MNDISATPIITVEIRAMFEVLKKACLNAGSEAMEALSKLEHVLPLLSVASFVVSAERSVFALSKKMPGVNQNLVLKTLADRGYLYKQEGSWSAKAPHRHLFEERFINDERGSSKIVATKAGFLLLAEMYLKGELPMRKGCKPIELDVFSISKAYEPE
nr:hypothetical protein [uncultured Cohaesibacter sp.]